MPRRLGGFGVSLALVVGSVAAERAELIDRDQALALVFVAALVLVLSVGVLTLDWWRQRGNPSPAAAPGNRIRQGRHSVSVIGDHANVSVGIKRQDLTAARRFLNDQIAAGGEIQARIGRETTAQLLYQYNTVYRAAVVDWHVSTGQVVAAHFDGVRGRYSSTLQLPTLDEFVKRHGLSRTPALLRSEVEGFLSARIAELRELLLWSGE